MSSQENNKKKKFRHVGANLYQIGADRRSAASAVQSKKASSYILKTGSRTSQDSLKGLKINEYVPSEIEKKEPVLQDKPPITLNSTVSLEDIKKNLKDLKVLQTRLRFVLKELEECVNEA